MTKQQIEYLNLYEAGYSVKEIARMKGRSCSSVSRTLRRARGKECPFSADCKLCPLPDCAIDGRYALLLNGQAKGRHRNENKKIF